MKVVITGGCGYFGSNLASLLLSRNYKVKVLTRNKKDKKIPENIIIEEISWKDEESLINSMQGYDAVVHMAGMNASDSMKFPSKSIKFKRESTRSILKICKKLSIPKIIFISSIHVYKNNLEGFISETSPRENKNPYAKSLSAGEDAILFNREENNPQKIILRCSNGYGPPVFNSKECWNLLLNQACLKATQNLTIDIMNPNSLRNFIPIKESCRAIEFFLRQNKVYSGVVNVGSEETFTVSQIMDFVKERASLIVSKNLEINILSKIPEKKKPTNLFFSTNLLKDLGFKFKYDHKTEIDNLLRYCEKRT
tara:strand:- start:12322 stop:13251 length:930 start_codon:yes stop_codon:yes gene_type:complete